MTGEYHRLLLVFVDGLGLAAESVHNPLTRVPGRGFHRLLGGPLTLERCQARRGLVLSAVDATLGVDGLPQSATGQASLFTGINAAKMMGRHVTGLPGPRVRSLVESGNLLSAAVDRGLRCTFANAYSQSYLDSLASGERRPSVTTCAVSSAGLAFRRTSHLREDRAVSWDICRDRFAGAHLADLPLTKPRQAGRHLARIAMRNQLTVFETFITDMAGHGRLGLSVEEALTRIDGLVDGATRSMSGETTLLMTSDHGNIEDSRHRRHTRNQVPLLVIGPLANQFSEITTILDITPRILDALPGPSDADRLALGPANLL